MYPCCSLLWHVYDTSLEHKLFFLFFRLGWRARLFLTKIHPVLAVAPCQWRGNSSERFPKLWHSYTYRAWSLVLTPLWDARRTQCAVDPGSVLINWSRTKVADVRPWCVGSNVGWGGRTVTPHYMIDDSFRMYNLIKYRYLITSNEEVASYDTCCRSNELPLQFC